MTGHGQVSVDGEISEYRERVEVNPEYIRDRPIRAGFEIQLRTAPTVLRRRDAYCVNGRTVWDDDPSIRTPNAQRPSWKQAENKSNPDHLPSLNDLTLWYAHCLV
jgi:hypothetical protein